jgi:hypothetical protein
VELLEKYFQTIFKECTMKTILLTFVAFLLALIVGCQESFVNEPTNSLGKANNSVKKDVLKICCEVKDPLTGICNVNGSVIFTHQIVTRSMNPTGLLEVQLYLEMDSDLCDPLGMVHLEWKSKGRSEDIVYVSEEGIAFVEKSYPITNRPDVVLLVRYMVTTDGVGISQISLAEIES